MSQAEDVRDIKGTVAKIESVVKKTLAMQEETDDDHIPLRYIPRSWGKTQKEILEMQKEQVDTLKDISEQQVGIANTLKAATENGAANGRGLSRKHKAMAVGGVGAGSGAALLAGVLITSNLPQVVKDFLIQILGG